MNSAGCTRRKTNSTELCTQNDRLVQGNDNVTLGITDVYFVVLNLKSAGFCAAFVA